MQTAKYECFDMIVRLHTNEELYEKEYLTITNPLEKIRVRKALDRLKGMLTDCRNRYAEFLKNESL